MKLHITLSTVIAFCLHQAIQAQDSIVFTSRVDPSAEYKIPLVKTDVRVKTKGNAHFKALIAHYSDTSIVFRPLQNTRPNRKAARNISREFWKNTHLRYLTGTAYDSLLRIASAKVADIMYPVEQSVRIAEISEIDISNYDRPDREKRTRRLDYTGTMGAFAAHYSPLAQSFPLAEKMYNMTLGFSVEAVVVEKEKLDLINQWSVKRSESTETASVK
ncbi:MAG TPA: hypothetical protein VD905_11400 [Flavobacteriales bacterium]|nr:hypothetical protein [Flavobacteriales bacterium]